MDIIKWLEENGTDLWWNTRGYKVTDIISFKTKDGLWCIIKKLTDLVQPYWCYVVTVQKTQFSQYVEASRFVRSLDGIV
jgi:hypothetical protein